MLPCQVWNLKIVNIFILNTCQIEIVWSKVYVKMSALAGFRIKSIKSDKLKWFVGRLSHKIHL
jgi:hypothetical protein